MNANKYYLKRRINKYYFKLRNLIIIATSSRCFFSLRVSSRFTCYSAQFNLWCHLLQFS